jgi:hypothetical protein
MNKILEKSIPRLEWERDVLKLRLNDCIAKRNTLEQTIERNEQKLNELELYIGKNAKSLGTLTQSEKNWWRK